MAETIPEANAESIQHFITDSRWDYQAMFDQIARDTDAQFADDPDTFFVLDESAFSKKGTKSAGVSRQWNGRLGKVDNCQVGVFAALGCTDKATFIDGRLFLPDSWTSDAQRCLEAGVPCSHSVQKSKLDLALEMIVHARKNHLRFHWVTADAFYGNSHAFRRKLNELSETYMLDIHQDTVVYLQDPQPIVPQRRSTRGREPKRLKVQSEGIRVDKWVAQQADSTFESVTVRDTDHSKLKVPLLRKTAWLWDGESATAEKVHLLVRREGTVNRQFKYSVSNAPEATSLKRLGLMQAQRYWVERTLQDAKSNVGMADYQVRGWTGWHHHMAMVFLAMLFLLETKITFKEQYALLSARDIKELLIHFLPKRKISEAEVIRQMHERHRKRRIYKRFESKT